MAVGRGKKKVIIPIVIVIVPVFMFLIGKWLFLMIGLMLLEEPNKPKIASQEFSFTLIYSVNGQTKRIKDKFCCEFDGIGVDEARGKYLEWKGSFKSGKKEIILWEGENKNGLRQEIYFNVPHPGYYMGDPYYEDGNEGNYSDIVLRCHDKDDYYESFISEKRLYKDYKISIINWQCDPPIMNSFE